MIYFLAAFAAYFVASFALGAIWHLTLFKKAYETAAGDFLLADPIFKIGFAAITLNGIAMLAAFSFAYPLGPPTIAWAITILAVIWTPHFVAIMATVAKYKIADRARYLTLEAAFSLANIVVLGLVLRTIFTALR